MLQGPKKTELASQWHGAQELDGFWSRGENTPPRHAHDAAGMASIAFSVLQETTTMLAREVTVADLERLGAILEPLVNSTRLSEDEKWAVETAARAAVDLAMLRHSEIARAFYARDDIQQRSVDTIQSWLAANPNATPGTVTAICGRMHVASLGADGKLQLFPLLDL